MRPRLLLETLFARFPSNLVTSATVGSIMGLRLHIGSPVSSELRPRLESATGSNLGSSTLETYANIFAATELSRMVKESVYCPYCLSNDAGIPYMRLLWDVHCVRACPIHRVKLVPLRPAENCSACQSQRLPLAQRPFVRGVCSVCGQLAYRCSAACPEPAGREDLWIAEQVGRLLSAPASVREGFSCELLQLGLRSLVNGAYGGSVVRAATEAGLSRGSVSTWIRGARAGLPWILQLCLDAGADVVALLNGEFVEMPEAPRSSYKVSERTYSLAETSGQDIEHHLRQAATQAVPPSLREFGRRHGVHFDSIRHRFPSETAALTKSRAEFLEGQRQRQLNLDIAAFQQAANSLTAQGKAVHKKSLQKQSGLTAMIRTNRTRYKALTKVLAETSIQPDLAS